MPHAKLWRGMATTTASLLILSLGTSAIADSRAGFLNAQLGTSNYKTIKIDTKRSDSGRTECGRTNRSGGMRALKKHRSGITPECGK